MHAWSALVGSEGCLLMLVMLVWSTRDLTLSIGIRGP